MHKKYGDMYEFNLAGQRSIMLCRTDLIENMFIPSTKTKYPIRNLPIEGFIEYGINGLGIVNNIDHKFLRYNRQFFSQFMMSPTFNRQNIDWTNELWEEMESYWNNLGENKELDLIKWIRRFANEIIFQIATGIKSDAVVCYYNVLIPENNYSLNEKDKERMKESEDFMKSFDI